MDAGSRQAERPSSRLVTLARFPSAFGRKWPVVLFDFNV